MISAIPLIQCLPWFKLTFALEKLSYYNQLIEQIWKNVFINCSSGRILLEKDIRGILRKKSVFGLRSPQLCLVILYYMTLDKSFNFPDPQYLHLYNEQWKSQHLYFLVVIYSTLSLSPLPLIIILFPPLIKVYMLKLRDLLLIPCYCIIPSQQLSILIILLQKKKHLRVVK